MTDLISRQAAIDALNKYVDYNDDGEQEINTDCVFHTLEELPSAPQWIPCSERLPEIEHDYLVTILNSFVTIASFQKLEGWSVWDDEAQAWDITAWRPLPEPYKGVTE